MTLFQKTPTRTMLYLVFTAISLLTVVYSRSSAAAPTISWTPSSLAAEITAGQSSTRSATFTASENASNVTLRVVPELAPYITVSPSTFASVSKGVSNSIQVTFAPAATATPGTHDGTIHIRQGAKTLAKPLPTKLSVAWPMFDENGDFGITINYPPGWYVTPKKNAVVFRNIENSSPRMEDILYAESFFQVSRRMGVNRELLPIDEWLEKLSAGTSDETLSKEPLSINGHDAVRVEVSEFGGIRVHIYIFADKDVVEVSYGLFAPLFIADYEAMLQSLSFVE